ncbi:hypothetical protein GM661_00060 [Iocasia frigidifontis]|uniref:Uncharacterized protein n=1 Tax=Iocasia fonsfrigidae TaxID=2682810 RepID=A0A8A7KAW8_9FIRM|nr:hypothetical protein [Iocasia fonsfrigidae]QTL96479.1 hypothetical protein GM661_00060 [Iocasia fonsfrigidae]
MKKSRYILLLIFILIISSEIKGTEHFKLDGWCYIDGKANLELWQKKEAGFISENIINNAVALGCEVLKGYTLKDEIDKESAVLQSNNCPFGFWRLDYTGYDSSGNIYFKLYTHQDRKIKNINEIINEISKITKLSDGDNIIYQKIILFEELLGDFLKEDGEVIIVDPEKDIIINNINEIPVLKIEASQTNSIINVRVVALE